MRPRLFAAEIRTIVLKTIRQDAGFNEAAAFRRGNQAYA